MLEVSWGKGAPTWGCSRAKNSKDRPRKQGTEQGTGASAQSPTFHHCTHQPSPLGERQQANLRRGGRRQRTTTKSLAHRDCDLLFFFASSESAGTAEAAAAALPSASLPSGARDLGPEELGGFFRRTLASVTSVAENEFLLPVTKSRSDDNDDTELSLPRLFRPLQGHEDFCGGAGLLVSLAMTPVVQRRLDLVSQLGLGSRRRPRQVLVLPCPGREGRHDAVGRCLLSGRVSKLQPRILCRARCLCRAPLRSQVCSGRCSGERMWVDGVADIHLAGETCF